MSSHTEGTSFWKKVLTPARWAGSLRDSFTTSMAAAYRRSVPRPARSMSCIWKPPTVPRPGIDGGLKANAMPPGTVQRRGCSRCTMAPVACSLPGRSSQGLSTGMSTPLLDCGALARKLRPLISMTVSTSGCSWTILRASAARALVRSSGVPGGSWYATKK